MAGWMVGMLGSTLAAYWVENWVVLRADSLDTLMAVLMVGWSVDQMVELKVALKAVMTVGR